MLTLLCLFYPVDEKAGSDEVEEAEEGQHHHHCNGKSHLGVIFAEEVIASITQPCSGIVQMLQLLVLQIKVIKNARSDHSQPAKTQAGAQNSQESPNKI